MKLTIRALLVMTVLVQLLGWWTVCLGLQPRVWPLATIHVVSTLYGVDLIAVGLLIAWKGGPMKR